VLLSVEFWITTLKTYLKGAPFYNALQASATKTSSVSIRSVNPATEFVIFAVKKFPVDALGK
jgi:hypothetical protein